MSAICSRRAPLLGPGGNLMHGPFGVARQNLGRFVPPLCPDLGVAQIRIGGLRKAAVSERRKGKLVPQTGGADKRARNGGPGLGLVTVEQHPTHSRARVLLTAKGRSVAKAILQQMQRPVDERRPVECENCKRWFLPQRSGAKTCSPRCRLALHGKRKAVAVAAFSTVAGDGVSSLAAERRPGSFSK